MKLYSTPYTYSLCEKCKSASCCVLEGGIALTASDVLRYATSFNMSIKDFLLKYTVDRFEDFGWEESYKYLLTYSGKDFEQCITFLAKREPYFDKPSYCIFSSVDKESGSIRCLSYACRSRTCREFYADGCMEHNTYAVEHYFKALVEEDLVGAFTTTKDEKTYLDIALKEFEIYQELKKNNGYMHYDLSKYQIDINTKLEYFRQKRIGSITCNKVDSIPISKETTNCTEPSYKKICSKNFGALNNPNSVKPIWIQPVRYKYEVALPNHEAKTKALFNGLRYLDSLVKWFPEFVNPDSKIDNMCELWYYLDMMDTTSYDSNVSKYAKIIKKKLTINIKEHINKFGLFKDNKNAVKEISGNFSIPFVLKKINIDTSRFFKDSDVKYWVDFYYNKLVSLKGKRFNFDFACDALVYTYGANIYSNDKYLKQQNAIMKMIAENSVLVGKFTKSLDAFYAVTHICLVKSKYSLEPLNKEDQIYIDWLKRAAENFKDDCESFAEYLECSSMLGIRDEQYNKFIELLIKKQNCDGSWSGVPLKKEGFEDKVFRFLHSTVTAIDALRETKAYHFSKGK